MTSSLLLYYTALAVILAWSLAMRWRASASYRRCSFRPMRYFVSMIDNLSDSMKMTTEASWFAINPKDFQYQLQVAVSVVASIGRYWRIKQCCNFC